MDIFNLPPGHSERDIKRAYAKALKKIDIDENPNEFQQLHNAYQHALLDFEEQQWGAESQPLEDTQTGCADADSIEASLPLDVHQHEANHNGNDTVESFEQAQESLWQMPEGEGNNEQEHTIESHWEPEESNETSPEEASLSEEQEATAQHYQQQLELLDQKLEQLLATPKECKQLYPWLFLNDFPELNDYDFWIEASRLVYHRIAESQSSEYKGKRPDITQEVLAFLDSIFNWFEYLQDPEEPAYNHHQTIYNRIQGLHGFQPPSATSKTEPRPSTEHQLYLPVLFAVTVDVLFLTSAFYLSSGLFSSSPMNILFSNTTAPAFGFIYYIACIASPLQGTLGQYINNIKVVTYESRKPDFWDALRRGTGLMMLVAFLTCANIYDLDFSEQPINWLITALPLAAILSWNYLKNTELKVREVKSGTLKKDTLVVSVIAAIIDWLFIMFVLIGLQEAFSQPLILALENKHSYLLYLLYYLLFLASPINGTLGHLLLKVKVVDAKLRKPKLKDIIYRGSGLIFWTLASYATLLLSSEQQEQFSGQLGILVPIVCFFVWKQFNATHLTERSLKT